jgi:ATP-binding cassette subfamily F protein uup
VSLKLGDKVMLKDFSYEFCRGDKIGHVGFNGMGKSTFIPVISVAQPIDSGEIEPGDSCRLDERPSHDEKTSKQADKQACL